MKTNQEILKFYGIEIEKTYRVIKVRGERLKGYYGKIFKIIKNPLTMDGLTVVFGRNGHSLAILNYCDYEEVKPPILDDKEREFLQKYVMDNPAFKGKVKSIVKVSRGVEFLGIHLTSSDKAFLPEFKPNSMYKGMEIGKNYTPKELGLEE